MGHILLDAPTTLKMIIECDYVLLSRLSLTYRFPSSIWLWTKNKPHSQSLNFDLSLKFVKGVGGELGRWRVELIYIFFWFMYTNIVWIMDLAF